MNITEEHKAQAEEIRRMLRSLDPRVRYYLSTHLQVEENVYDSAEDAAQEVESFDGSPTTLEGIDLVVFLEPINIRYTDATEYEILTEGEAP